jgi:hypothetical protein
VASMVAALASLLRGKRVAPAKSVLAAAEEGMAGESEMTAPSSVYPSTGV